MLIADQFTLEEAIQHVADYKRSIFLAVLTDDGDNSSTRFDYGRLSFVQDKWCFVSDSGHDRPAEEIVCLYELTHWEPGPQ